MPKRLSIAIAVLPVAAVLAVPALAGADVFEVTKRGDHVPGACTNADCTLREAVIEANAQPGNDRVELPSRKVHRLTRELGLGPTEPEDGDLDLDAAAGNEITLVHPGSGRATIDATGAEDRAIELVGTGTLRKIVLRDGDANSTGEAGGAVLGEGRLIIILSRIRGSEASDVGGGIFITTGTLKLRKSDVSGNEANGEGGGIFVDDDARFELKKSTVADNDADDGAGIFSGSEALGNTILATTIADNAASEEGGGVWNSGPSLLLSNSTVADNTAGGSGGGLYAAPDSGTVLESVTIARNRADVDDLGPDNGGGIFADGGDDVVLATNTLLARNRTTGGAFQDCDAPAPVGIVTAGGNLLTSEQDCPFFDDAEDISDDEPLIGSLADNGGPTQTIKLKQGGPAIDEADGAGALQVDQRGLERNDPDIGAFERQ